MPKAIAVVAHHDDHVLWMGGAIQRLTAHGWHCTLVAMCVRDPARRDYFRHCCSIFGAIPLCFEFDDYMKEEDALSPNNREEMQHSLNQAIQGQSYDLVFTHSRNPSGEYSLLHANHEEVRSITENCMNAQGFGTNVDKSKLAYFDYHPIYGAGTATCAQIAEANTRRHLLQLTYPELIWKGQLCALAPDVNTNLKNLAFPCPNPEAFEGDDLEFPNLPHLM
jgi:LmbE family N-acetylglucosaminyl deacetylase